MLGCGLSPLVFALADRGRWDVSCLEPSHRTSRSSVRCRFAASRLRIFAALQPRSFAASPQAAGFQSTDLAASCWVLVFCGGGFRFFTQGFCDLPQFCVAPTASLVWVTSLPHGHVYLRASEGWPHDVHSVDCDWRVSELPSCQRR